MDPYVDGLRRAKEILSEVTTPGPTEAAVTGRLAQELDDAISRFEGRPADVDLASVVCHDLKDPLASIVMGAGFLRKTLPAEQAAGRRVVEAIARSADRLGHVIQDFHDVAKLEAGRLSVDVRPCDIAAAMRVDEGALALLRERATEREVKLEIELPDQSVYGRCDPTRMLQALSKLVDNAIKFTPGGGRIVIRLEGDERAARVIVSDTGRGIPADRVASIFDRRANCRRVPRDGPGLGLAIVKGIVEIQGGHVEVESKPGEGSRFTMTFPR